MDPIITFHQAGPRTWIKKRRMPGDAFPGTCLVMPVLCGSGAEKVLVERVVKAIDQLLREALQGQQER